MNVLHNILAHFISALSESFSVLNILSVPSMSMPIMSMPMVQMQGPGTQQDPRAQLLAQMHDVKMPEVIGWWPPAPGWILVGLIVIAAIIYGMYRAYGLHKKRRYRKVAQRELAAIRQRLYQDKTLTSEQAVRESLQLIKRTFFTAYPGSRRYIAGLEGAPWIQLLKDTSKHPIPEQNLAQEIQRALYHPNQNAIDNETIFIFCELWIKQHANYSEQIQQRIVGAAARHLNYEENSNLRGAYV